MLIKVISFSGQEMEFTLDSKDTIIDLKKKIEDKGGIAFEHQRLLFSGRQLEDNMKPSHYGIQSGFAVHLVLALRGG